MPNTSMETLTRAQVSENKFKHQVDKAIRKGKLIEVLLATNLFSRRDSGVTTYSTEDRQYDTLIVDPAFLFYNHVLHSDQFDAFEFGIFDPSDIDSLMQNVLKFDYTIPAQRDKPEHRRFEILHPDAYSRQSKSAVELHRKLIQDSSTDKVYDMIVAADPTPNKEYVQWILVQYVRVLKDRIPRTDVLYDENKMGGFAYRFFEDLDKLCDALKIFHKIKNSKALTTEEKDIYTYSNINDFIEVVFKAGIDPTQEVNYDVLSASELQMITNKEAHLMYQDRDWMIIHTETKLSNAVFGADTTWCTAGTRFGSSFDHYDKQGKLFVVIKNKLGSQSHLRLHPENRLQFHFDTKSFMNALDRSIKLSDFFAEFPNIKAYFREYIVNMIMKKFKRVDDIIKQLTEFGLVTELIPILRDAKVKELELANVTSKNLSTEFKDLGDIITLEKITIKDSGLTEIPESIRKLKNLTALRLPGNKLSTIPVWINELTKLEALNLMGNDLTTAFDISGLHNLTYLHLATNKKLVELPTGIDKLVNLLSLDCSFCNIKEIPDTILACRKLNSLSAARNKSLTKIPMDVVKIPELLFISLDDTAISAAKIAELKNNKLNPHTTIL